MPGEINNPNRISFTDRLLPDGSVERVYSNGTRERRVRQGPGVIAWNDSQGRSGRDINLGGGRIRREEANGNITEGQQVGHGVTIWNNGQFIAVNLTPLPESPLPPPPAPTGLSGLLMGLGLGGLFGISAAGPYGTEIGSDEYYLYAEEAARQEALKRAQQQAGAGDSGGSSGDSGDGGSDDSAWSDDSGATSGDWGGTDSFG